MYPGTIFNWFDNSQRTTPNVIAEVENKPLFMVVSSSDKGKEGLAELKGEAFNAQYGIMSFEKHGQNGIQAQNIINAGGRLLFYRVCAEDATLANLVLTATVTETETAKLDEEGNALYLDENGEETTTVTDSTVMDKSASIIWEASSIAGCKTFEEVKE